MRVIVAALMFCIVFVDLHCSFFTTVETVMLRMSCTIYVRCIVCYSLCIYQVTSVLAVNSHNDPTIDCILSYSETNYVNNTIPKGLEAYGHVKQR